MSSFNPEEMTLEEIKEQLALYNRFYYQRRRTETTFMETKRASALRHQRRRKIDKMVENGEIDIKTLDPKNPEKALDEALKATKPRKYKGETYKVITVEE